MQYILLIYGAEPTESVPEDQMLAEMEGYNAFTAHLRERGAMLAGEALVPTASATTVRVVDGRTVTTDGPFAETKEQVGGYFLVECENLDDAIDAAAKLPGAQTGSIEVRPIWEM